MLLNDCFEAAPVIDFLAALGATLNLRACQLLLGHTKLESTVRYLGIEVDDALALSEQTDL